MPSCSLVYFSSVSENTHRFVQKLGVPATRIPLHGLIEVDEQERHGDGRIVDFDGDTELHDLRLISDGFAQSAFDVFMDKLPR